MPWHVKGDVDHESNRWVGSIPDQLGFERKRWKGERPLQSRSRFEPTGSGCLDGRWEGAGGLTGERGRRREGWEGGAEDESEDLDGIGSNSRLFVRIEPTSSTPTKRVSKRNPPRTGAPSSTCLPVSLRP